MKVKKDHAQMKPGDGEKAPYGENSDRTCDRQMWKGQMCILSQMHFHKSVPITLMLVLGKLTACH